MALQSFPFERRHSPSRDSNSTADLATNLFRTVLLKSQTVNSYGEDIDSSTAEFANSQLLYEQATSIFSNAREEIFEDGMESKFSLNLSEFIVSFGHPAMETIINLLLSNRLNTEVASEAFRVLGRLRHKNTYRDRLWLLERGLYNRSARVRDGAALGFAFLNDQLAIAPLQAAIERELIPELRKDMEQILAQLEGKEDGIPIKKDTKK
jgi:hypothetical protein